MGGIHPESSTLMLEEKLVFISKPQLCFQLTGVLIGAAVAVSLIGIVVLFLYRRFKLSRESS